MNLLEIWIKHIYSEEEVHPVFNGIEQTLIKVDVDTECYGVEERVINYFTKEEWELAKALGYWFG